MTHAGEDVVEGTEEGGGEGATIIPSLIEFELMTIASYNQCKMCYVYCIDKY